MVEGRLLERLDEPIDRTLASIQIGGLEPFHGRPDAPSRHPIATVARRLDRRGVSTMLDRSAFAVLGGEARCSHPPDHHRERTLTEDVATTSQQPFAVQCPKVV